MSTRASTEPGIDRQAIARSRQEPLGPGVKGLPPGSGGLSVEQLVARGLRALDGDCLLPVAVLKDKALRRNLDAMAAFCARTGVSLAPHGKTTMAPELFARQLEAGCWGVTAAVPSQVELYRAYGVRRILLANELVDRAALAWLGAELDRDPSFAFACYVDSVAAVEQMSRGLAREGPARPVDVVLEVGHDGGRTGARSLDTALAVARAVARTPALRLVGVGGYEGTIGEDRRETTLDTVDGFLRQVVTVFETVVAEGLVVDDCELLLTAGGSALFDRVVTAFSRVSVPGREVRVVLRSGCYLSHDSGMYDAVTPSAQPGWDGDRFAAALEIWGMVVSRPEEDLALVNVGKRDVSFDVEPPIPLVVRTTSGEMVAAPDAGILGVIDLNDQHAYLRLAEDAALEVGALVGLGVSHPCTTFDRWRLLLLVDDDYRVLDGIRTYF